jgi:hypothetical protein
MYGVEQRVKEIMEAPQLIAQWKKANYILIS